MAVSHRHQAEKRRKRITKPPIPYPRPTSGKKYKETMKKTIPSQLKPLELENEQKEKSGETTMRLGNRSHVSMCALRLCALPYDATEEPRECFDMGTAETSGVVLRSARDLFFCLDDEGEDGDEPERIMRSNRIEAAFQIF